MTQLSQFRTCPLCEATCGVEVVMDDGRVTSVRGDPDDVFSKGFICPKGTAIKHLHDDPDQLSVPVLRSGEEWRETSWEEAFGEVTRGLTSVIERYGRDSVAIYVGNPSVHSLSATVMTPILLRAARTKNYYSAATVDQMPKHASCGFMFGNPLLIPVPDIDRTHYLMVVGANPWVSNGSLATAPDFRGRLQAISDRGGKVVVVDPRRTPTAAGADEHIFIRPGTDAFFLLAIARTLFELDRVDLGDLAPHIEGLDEVRSLVEPFAPEKIAAPTGVPAETTRRIAMELAEAPSAAVYDRVGAHQQEFGTLTSWASDLITALTGNLDRPGGKMFPYAAHGRPDPETPRRKGWLTGRFASRVKGYPEVFGQLPVATLADEIETVGDGRVRALVTLAGNPVLSTPNGARLARALGSLEYMVSIDPYVNETTRFASAILPPPSILARHHYDFAFYGLSVRNIANYSPPLVPAEGPDEWEILARVTLAFSGQEGSTDPALVPQMALAYLVSQAVAPDGPLAARDSEEILRSLEGRQPIEQILDFRLRSGPYGDRFGENPEGLSLAALEASPHGIDLGPLMPRLPNALQTASGKVELTPPDITADIPRLNKAIDRAPNGIVLIGRRQLRSNNSWMHNVPTMMKGSNKCTLLIHPQDATRLDLEAGSVARITSRVGTVEAPVEITDEVMPGVVSLPHGWGHGLPGVRLTVAGANEGVSSNDLTDEQIVEPLSGNAVLNAVPVQVERVLQDTEKIPSETLRK